MKLSKNDKELLMNMGVPTEDFEQIERATTKTTFTRTGLTYNDMGYLTTYKEKIGIRKAIKILGRREFLSGLSRSAFHYTAMRGVGTENILFDSSKLFKED